MTDAQPTGDFVPLEVECIGGGKCYVGHGLDVVLIATTEDVKFWRNSFWLTPGEARRLAAILLQQADATDLASGDGYESDALSDRSGS